MYFSNVTNGILRYIDKLNLIKEIDYIEIVDVKENSGELPIEHRDLLDKRLQQIENGETTFKNWDLIKKKYESKAI